MSSCQAVDMMQMDPDYCLRRLTETVYNHVCLLVVVLAGTDGQPAGDLGYRSAII